MENPNWSVTELKSPPGEPSDRSRNKDAKQLTWVLLLSAHRAAGCLASVGAAGKTDSSSEKTETRLMFYSCIKVFLCLSVLLLIFEAVAFFKGWDFDTRRVRLERFNNIKPVPVAGTAVDPESGRSGFFPMVLVQISMCNEKEVYMQSIAAVCNLDWPKANLLIQVLDDSNDPVTSLLIKEEVLKWQQHGAPIVYRHRVIRDGYKAGNLKSAMNCSYVKDYEFVAIFDADFQPNPDFLTRTVPHFKDNDELGLVQARWSL